MKESNNIKKVVLFSLASACIGLISCDDYLKEKDLPARRRSGKTS